MYFSSFCRDIITEQTPGGSENVKEIISKTQELNSEI